MVELLEGCRKHAAKVAAGYQKVVDDCPHQRQIKLPNKLSYNGIRGKILTYLRTTYRTEHRGKHPWAINSHFSLWQGYG